MEDNGRKRGELNLKPSGQDQGKDHGSGSEVIRTDRTASPALVEMGRSCVKVRASSRTERSGLSNLDGTTMNSVVPEAD